MRLVALDSHFASFTRHALSHAVARFFVALLI
jgi:hypothetical protein